MKIISLNCNGLRSALRKGLSQWLEKEAAHIVLLQELKIDQESLTHINELSESGKFLTASCAQKKGYSGTAVLSLRPADEVINGFGVEEFDHEGRLCAVRFNDLWVMSCYFPSGSANEDRQASKERFMPVFKNWLADFSKTACQKGQSLIVSGDLNIARSSLDLKNWKSNQKNSGFLPHERLWIDDLIHDCGLIDCYRHLNAQSPGYTWWSQRGNAKANNVGWRIDYHLASQNLVKELISTTVEESESFSDHVPLVLQINKDFS